MRQFRDVFRGREDCYGETLLKSESKEGVKNSDYDARFVKSNVSDEHYAQHLDPEKEYLLGICPVDIDGMCHFAAIDVDIYKDGRELGRKLRAKVDQLGLPLIPCFSKSFATHLYAFFKEPVPAVEVREFMEQCRVRLELPKKVEIFPKQDEIKGGMTGSYINLPYWKSERCMAVGADGQDMSIEDFLQEVSAVEMTRDEMKNIHGELDQIKNESDDFLKEGPPCVVKLIEGGIPQGERSNALTNIAVFAKKRSEQVDGFDWEAWLMDVNYNYCTPPMSATDLSQIIRSVGRTEMGYLCKQQPMVGLCDKASCLKKRFGVGGSTPVDVCDFEIFSITKILASPPYYMVKLVGYEDRDIKMTSAHLTQPKNFVRAVFEQLDIIFETPRASTLAEMVNAITIAGDKKQFIVEDAPEELEDVGNILALLQQWITDHVVPQVNLEELESNNAIWNKGQLMFRGNAFLTYLRSKGQIIDKTKVFDALRHQRAEDEWFNWPGKFEYKVVSIESKKIYLWCLPMKTAAEGGWFEPPVRETDEAF